MGLFVGVTVGKGEVGDFVGATVGKVVGAGDGVNVGYVVGARVGFITTKSPYTLQPSFFTQLAHIPTM